MSRDRVTHGPGNNVAHFDFQYFRAGAAITKGWGVAYADSTAVTALGTGYVDGVVVVGSDIDASNPTLGFCIGFAMDAAAAAGDWIRVCTGGKCPVNIVTDGSVEEGDALIPTTAEGVMAGTAGETQDLLGCAIALADDSGTALAKAMVISRV